MHLNWKLSLKISPFFKIWLSINIIIIPFIFLYVRICTQVVFKDLRFSYYSWMPIKFVFFPLSHSHVSLRRLHGTNEHYYGIPIRNRRYAKIIESLESFTPKTERMSKKVHIALCLEFLGSTCSEIIHISLYIFS